MSGADPGKDSDVRNDLSRGGASAYGAGVTGTTDGYGVTGTVRAGDVDVLRLDPSKDLPGGASAIPGIATSAAKLGAGDAEWDELAAIAGSAADLGLNVVVYLADPLNFLITAGLTFLIDVVQPLEDLLGWVTGNPERMEAEIAKWDRVGNALEPLAKELRAAAEQGLIGWEGRSAEAAKARLVEFSEGMASVGNDVKQLQMIMGIAKTVMEVAQAFVIGLIATFVEWLVFTWTAALAAAAPTFGASTAAAGAATGVQGGIVATRAASFISRVVAILKRLRTVLYRMHPRAMRRVQANFQLRGANGRFVSGWVGAGPALRESLTDWRPYAGAAVKGVTTGIQEGKRMTDSGADTDPAVTRQQLDPNR